MYCGVDWLKAKTPRKSARPIEKADHVVMAGKGAFAWHNAAIGQYGICRKGKFPLDAISRGSPRV